MIDHQSMAELMHSFEELAKAADVVMKELEGHWYTFGTGSAGADNAMKKFGLQYEHLLSLRTDAGKDDAANLLTGTLKTAQEVLRAQQAIKKNRDDGGGVTDDSFAAQQMLQAHKASLTVTQSEIDAQQLLVDTLNNQVHAQEQVSELKKLNSGNATKTESNAGAAEAAKAAQAAAESQGRLGEQALAGERATADATLTIHRAGIEARLASDLDFAARDRDLKEAVNAAEIAGLDKSGKDYHNQLAAHNEKTLEINSEYATKTAELNAKASVAENSRELQQLQESARLAIDNTLEGTAARMAAINAGIKEEQAARRQDMNFFSDLLKKQAEEVKKEQEDEAKAADVATKQTIAAREVAAKEQTRHSGAMEKTKPQVNDFAEKQRELDREFAAEHAAKVRELADAAKMGKDKTAEERKINDEILALDQKYQNQTKELADQEANTHREASARMANDYAQGFLRVAEGQESLRRMASSVADSVISNSLKAMIATKMHAKSEQVDQAKVWASGAGSAVAKIPFVGPILAPIAAAAGFMAAMAFEKGGIVPGVGMGDTVPAMLTPGEGIVPKGVMEGLADQARNGNQSRSTTFHYRPTFHVQTVDGDGVRGMLEKHTEEFSRHFRGVVRKMNR